MGGVAVPLAGASSGMRVSTYKYIQLAPLTVCAHMHAACVLFNNKNRHLIAGGTARGPFGFHPKPSAGER